MIQPTITFTDSSVRALSRPLTEESVKEWVEDLATVKSETLLQIEAGITGTCLLEKSEMGMIMVRLGPVLDILDDQFPNLEEFKNEGEDLSESSILWKALTKCADLLIHLTEEGFDEADVHIALKSWLRNFI